MDYSLPRLRTKFGERAFSHAGPATWNALPDHIRTVADPVKFRKLLKHTVLVKLLTLVDFRFFLGVWHLADFCNVPRYLWSMVKGKGKVFPYSLPSVGSGADPGVQAVSPQVT